MIQRDKLLHAAAGGITLLAGCLMLLIAHHAGIGPALAFATTLVGGGYELLQRYLGNGHPSLPDALATAAPGWVVWGMLVAAERIA